MKFSAYSDFSKSVLGIKIKSCGHIFAKSGREVFRPDGRNDWLLFYLAKGNECFFIDSETEAPAGSFVIFRPGEKQHHLHRENKTAEFYYVHFEADDLEISSLETSRIYSASPSVEIVTLFENLIRDTAMKPTCYERLSVLRFMEILVLLEQRVARDASPYKHHFNKIELMIQRINRDYFENTSLEDYASACNMSKYHFLRAFENITGESPIAYRNRVRLERSRELLEDSELSISKIGETLGYSSQSYFCDAFKKAFGVSPSAYRKALQGANDEA